MARRRSSGDEPPKRAELKTSREEAKGVIGARMTEGQKLQDQVRSGTELRAVRRAYEKWDNFNKDLLGRIFTTDEYAMEYSDAYSASGLVIGYDEPSPAEQARELFQDIE